MNPANATVEEVRDLMKRLDAALSVAEMHQELTGAYPALDLTSPARVCMPVFPAADVAGPERVDLQIYRGAVEAISLGKALYGCETEAEPEPLETPCVNMTHAEWMEQQAATMPEAEPEAILETPEPAADPKPAAPQCVPNWTPEEDELALSAAILLDGAPKSDIYRAAAEATGRTADACKYRLRMALKPRLDVALKAAAKGKAPAPAADLRDDVIGAAEAAKIMALHGEGLSFNEIAAKTSRYPTAIYQLVKRMLAAQQADKDAEAHLSAPEVSTPQAEENKAETAEAQPDPAPEVSAPVEPKVDTPSAPAKAGIFMPADLSLPIGRREVRDWLNKIGNPGAWDAGTDLELVEALTSGTKLPQIAADLGLDTKACKWRWNMLTERILDDRGRVTLDGQAHLLAEVKARAGVGAAA